MITNKDRTEAMAQGRRAYDSGFSRSKAKRHAPINGTLHDAFMAAYDYSVAPISKAKAS